VRLFIAIELPDDVREHLVQLRDRLKAQIAGAWYTRDQNLHVTLKFLGEVDERRSSELIESLSKVRIGGAIQASADKIECFPDRGPLRIVAAGFGGDLDAFAALHRAIEQRCQHLGFERETRKYRPHVTLARARPTLPSSVRKIAAETAASMLPGPAFAVQEFALVQSRLKPQGAEYQTIQRFKFD